MTVVLHGSELLECNCALFLADDWSKEVNGTADLIPLMVGLWWL
jgi:hypothetical protein